MEEDRLDGAIVEEPEEAPKSSLILVAQFFIVPIIIVGLCVGVFLLFGLVTGETRTAYDYLEEIKAGSGNRRWQAAYELSKFISQKEASKDTRLVRDITNVFRSAGEDDPRVRQYLALALGRLNDPQAVEPLLAVLKSSSPDTKLYIIWALGELADPRAVDPLLEELRGSDHDVQKIAIFSLGLLKDPRAVPTIQGYLHDRNEDVRWNAALALARFGDASGRGTLHQMLDRKYLDTLPEVTEEQKTEAILNAARAVSLLKDSSARTILDYIKENDPSMKARNAAIEALKEIP